MIKGRRLNIILKQKNLAYETHLSACKKTGVDPLPKKEYSHKVGMLLVSLDNYPGGTEQEKYLKWMEEFNIEDRAMEETRDLSEGPVKSKKCCGGPSLLEKGKNYVTMKLEWIKRGRPLVDKEVVLERLKICSECDFLVKDWECSKCGCPMMEKTKMDMEDLCKEKKWL